MVERESKALLFVIFIIEDKFEMKMKKKLDDEKDEERVYRQLKQINDDFQREKLPKPTTTNSKQRETPINTPRRKDLDIQSMTGNHLAIPRENMKSQVGFRDVDTSGYESNHKGINDSFGNINRMRNERDN